MISRPPTDEYAPFYAGYVQRVPENADILNCLNDQPEELRALLQNVTDTEANIRPAPDEWSVKEVLGHLNDAERVFAYRAMRIARNDTKPLAGFEQTDYVSATDFSTRPLEDLLDEFAYRT